MELVLSHLHANKYAQEAGFEENMYSRIESLQKRMYIRIDGLEKIGSEPKVRVSGSLEQQVARVK